MSLKARCVLISDVHFHVNSLPLAVEALRQALRLAEKLGVPLVIAGDLNDTKAIMRAECINAIIEILSGAKVPVYVLIGNHDLINEKAKAHSLNFLKSIKGVRVVDEPWHCQLLDVWFIPYHADADELRKVLAGIPKGKTLIMHQGFKGAFMGEYVVDKSSIDPSEVGNYNVITGHYHRRQEVGTVHYIGSPYSTSFAEAGDPPKGVRVLTVDGIHSDLEFVPTNLRKHVVVECGWQTVMDPIPELDSRDLLWLKVHGPASELDKLNKKAIGEKLLGHSNFKLDRIYTELQATIEKPETLTNDQMLDKIIDDSEETKTQKTYLKKLWREICE